MKVILFGATGMVGQGVLRESLLDPDVSAVLSIGRRVTGQKHEKLREIMHPDLWDFSSIAEEMIGYDACFFCLGVASSGMTEADYRHVTQDIAVAAGRTLSERNPEMTFVFISGAGADSAEKSRTMWARVKGSAENAVLKMPFKAVYALRPAMIQPLHGITSRTKLYRVLYVLMWPLLPIVKAFFPGSITTTERLGRAMLIIAKRGAPKHLLESRDINEVFDRFEKEGTGAA